MRSCVAIAALGGAACGSGGEDPVRAVEWEEIEMPVGQGSEVPHLSATDGGVILSWIEPASDPEINAVKVSSWSGDGWAPVSTVAESDAFFVNWADFPSVVATESGDWVAHWLARGSEGGYDYGVLMSGMADDGGGDADWTDPWSPHVDDSPSEHGFVTTVPLDGDDLGVTWLDGRDFAQSESPEMQIRYRNVGPEGPRAPEVLLDGRTCECCQTDAARTDRGMVIVYRDRSEADIRDIGIVRELEDGEWSSPALVHADGWEILGCPVNGPAVDARGDFVVVAWFTGAQDEPRVQIAYSNDAGATFGIPTRVDGGAPLGRVDVVVIDGGAIVSWLEESGPEGEAQLRLRHVDGDGRAHDTYAVANTSAARRSGFPQMVRWQESLVMAWHDVDAKTIRGALLSQQSVR